MFYLTVQGEVCVGVYVCVCSVYPVSYTHLDVYKRQVVEDSRPVDFGKGRLRGRGSLPATFMF